MYPPPTAELKKIDFKIHFFGFLNFARWNWDSGLTYDFGLVMDNVDCYIPHAYVSTEKKKVYAFVFVFFLKMLFIASLKLLIWLKWNFKAHDILIYLGKYCIDFGLCLIQLGMVMDWVWGEFLYAQTRPPGPYPLPKPDQFSKQVFFFFCCTQTCPIGPRKLQPKITKIEISTNPKSQITEYPCNKPKTK